jgi:hypothetical protein
MIVNTPAIPRILVIEHDAWVRADVVAQLAGAGYQVRDASNGFTGLRLARGAPPDVIMLGEAARRCTPAGARGARGRLGDAVSARDRSRRRRETRGLRSDGGTAGPRGAGRVMGAVRQRKISLVVLLGVSHPDALEPVATLLRREGIGLARHRRPGLFEGRRRGLPGCHPARSVLAAHATQSATGRPPLEVRRHQVEPRANASAENE